MRSWLKLVVLAFVAVAASILLLSRLRSGPETARATAPSFTLPDVEGKTVSLDSLKGKVVAVNFWATWCGPCVKEIPELTKVWAEQRRDCFEILGIAEESGPRDVVLEAALKLGARYPILLDERGDVAKAFGIVGYPNTFLIDARGQVRRVFVGEVDGPRLRSALAPLLAETAQRCPPA